MKRIIVTAALILAIFAMIGCDSKVQIDGDKIRYYPCE